MSKKSVTNRILEDAANQVVSKRGQYLNDYEDELVLPDNPNDKTIDWYFSALDRACIDFFVYADDDKLIEVLKDAEKNGIYIKEYNSVPVKRFYSLNIFIRKATLFWQSGMVAKVRLYTNFGSVSITKTTNDIKGDVKYSRNLEKIIEAIQATLVEIDKLLS